MADVLVHRVWGELTPLPNNTGVAGIRPRDVEV